MESLWLSTSFESWSAEVTLRRSIYSQRLKSVRPTSAKGYSFWQSTETNCTDSALPFDKRSSLQRKLCVIDCKASSVLVQDQNKVWYLVQIAPTGVQGSESNWPTPRVSSSNGPSEKEIAQGNPKKRLEAEVALWPTPTVSGNNNRKGASKTSGDGLATKVKNWPTPSARDWKDSPNMSQTREGGRNRVDQLPRAVFSMIWESKISQEKYGTVPTPQDQERLSMDGSPPEWLRTLWRTPSAQEPGISISRLVCKDGSPPKHNKRLYDKETQRLAQIGLPQQVRIEDTMEDNLSDQAVAVYRIVSWPTPNTMDSMGSRSEDSLKRALKKGGCRNLKDVMTHPELYSLERMDVNTEVLGNLILNTEADVFTDMLKSTKNKNEAKLNPRWEEVLMGLPVGWTMPSCASPVTIELTKSVPWETESFLPVQNLLSDYYINALKPKLEEMSQIKQLTEENEKLRELLASTIKGIESLQEEGDPNAEKLMGVLEAEYEKLGLE